MSVISSPALFMGEDGYQISRSVRLRSSASAYFNKTFSGAGNVQTYTISFWAKRGALSTTQYLLVGFNGSVSSQISFNSSDQLVLNVDGGSGYQITTSAVYRDPSAWYHIVAVVDTTQATSSNRLKLYVNGVQVTALASSSYPPQNNNTYFFGATGHWIGSSQGPSQYFDGYLTEFNAVNGQALTPSSFGETDIITGVWKPKKYAGTYGTNGFYLNFSDNSAATAAAIGKDSSGNGNNWTPNNISVAAGTTYDSMIDTPTPYADGGTGRGNYAVLNPIVGGLTPTISYANLRVVGTSVNYSPINSSIPIPTTGKWYMEATITAIGNGAAFGITVATDPLNANRYPGQTSTSWGYLYDGNKYTNGSGSSYGASLTTNNVVGIAFDADAGTLVFYKDNASQGTAFSSLTSGPYLFVVAPAGNGSGTIDANFGQRPFAYTPPTGFKALNTQNLPEPTIKKGNGYFDVALWTGNNTARSITTNGDGNSLQFNPDFIWGKSRGSASGHLLYDAVRGVDKSLATNNAAAEDTTSGQLTAFSASPYGFQLPTDTAGYLNYNSRTYVGWLWKKGATPGFDIQTYTKSSSSQVISHSLGVAPSMIIVKSRSSGASSYNWYTYHKNMSSGYIMVLNGTSAQGSSPNLFPSVGSSSFTLGSDYTADGSTGVAYLFAEVAGFSRFGSYTGNGSTDGPFVYCGFRPRFILLKNTGYDNSQSWVMYDTVRATYNLLNVTLAPNSSNAESTSFGADIDVLSNGFKVRNSNTVSNASGTTIIYAAFAENPFKYALAR